jgi:hypothetical protein
MRVKCFQQLAFKVFCPFFLAFATVFHQQIFLAEFHSEGNINTKRNTIDGQMLA